MARTRLFVALLPDPPLWSVLDSYRRSLGVSEPFRIPPHVTLVPPVNVASGDLEDVDRILSEAAATVEPIDLELREAATFAPSPPSVQLTVHGDLVALGTLRSALIRGTLDRPGRNPFVPHVTLVPSTEQPQIDAALQALDGTLLPWRVRSVHVLERHHDPGRWVTVAELPLGRPAVVGRGGVASTMRTLRMVPMPVADLCSVAARGPAETPVEPEPLVVAAEADPGDGTGALQGAAVGLVTAGGVELRALTVAEAERAQGIGARLLSAWCSAAAELGATVVTAAGSTVAGRAFLERHGFTSVSGVLVRAL